MSDSMRSELTNERQRRELQEEHDALVKEVKGLERDVCITLKERDAAIAERDSIKAAALKAARNIVELETERDAAKAHFWRACQIIAENRTGFDRSSNPESIRAEIMIEVNKELAK